MPPGAIGNWGRAGLCTRSTKSQKIAQLRVALPHAALQGAVQPRPHQSGKQRILGFQSGLQIQADIDRLFDAGHHRRRESGDAVGQVLYEDIDAVRRQRAGGASP